MNIRLLTGFVALLSVAMVSCYPYKENEQKKKTTKKPDQTAVSPDQLKAKEDAAKKKADEEAKKTKDEVTETKPTTDDSGAGATTKPKTEKRSDYAFANKVPGKEGFVFSPYNQKVVDVRGMPSGTLVQDPTYPVAEKKFFRVP